MKAMKSRLAANDRITAGRGEEGPMRTGPRPSGMLPVSVVLDEGFDKLVQFVTLNLGYITV